MSEAVAPPRFDCPQCGAALTFAPRRQRLACGQCGYEAPPPREAAPEAARPVPGRIAEDAGAEEEARALACGACGAETLLDAGAQADLCPFCASPLVDAPERRRAIAPMAALPFLIDERDATERIDRWLASRWFAPSGLARAARRDGGAMTGLYLPFWSFDADGAAAYWGQRGDFYYVTQRVPVPGKKGVRMQTRRVRKTRWRAVSGRVAERFQQVLASGSPTLSARETRALLAGGFDFRALRGYDDAYLAGFRAELYRIPLDEGRQAAEAEMRAALKRAAARDIGGDRQRVERLDARFHGTAYRLTLLPVWIVAYRHRGARYRVVVNGRTGAVSGARPYDYWKIAGATLLLAAALGLAAFMLDALQL